MERRRLIKEEIERFPTYSRRVILVSRNRVSRYRGYDAEWGNLFQSPSDFIALAYQDV
jgi:hypothetical protein